MSRNHLVLIALGVFLIAGSLRAQSDQKPLTFEVASIKLNRSEAPPTSRFALGPGDAYAPGGLFTATNQPLIVYVRFAYKLGQSDESNLLHLPTWVYDERFDIAARAPGTPTKDQMRRMMRRLLGERFKLRLHTERRTQSAFDLMLAKSGVLGPSFSGTWPMEPAHQHHACSYRRSPAVASGRFQPVWADEDESWQTE